MSATPVRFTEERREAYLALLRQGMGRHESARAVGVDPATVVRYRTADPVYDVAVLRAEEEAAEPVSAKLYEAAKDGQPWAVKLWLSRRSQGKAGGASWAEGPQVVEVAVSGSVEVVAELGPAAARVAELRARLEERRSALAEAVDLVEGEDGAFGLPAGT